MDPRRQVKQDLLYICIQSTWIIEQKWFFFSKNVVAGFCYGQETVRDGERCSTAKAFLRPAMGRSNLHVSTNSYVTKVASGLVYQIYCKENTKYFGVQFCF